MGNHWLADHRRAPGQEVADLRRVIADEGGVTRADLTPIFDEVAVEF